MGALINDSSSGKSGLFFTSFFGYNEKIKNLPAAVDSKYTELISSITFRWLLILFHSL